MTEITLCLFLIDNPTVHLIVNYILSTIIFLVFIHIYNALLELMPLVRL